MNDRPRPIRVAIALIAGANMVALSVLPVLTAFGLIAWTDLQMGLVQTLIGTTTTAAGGVIAAIQGSDKNPLMKVQKALKISPAEAKVTPTSDPRDDGLVPLVPTAHDGLED